MNWVSVRSSGALRRSVLMVLAAAVPLLASGPAAAANYCPAVWKKGVLPLNFNPAFTTIDQFNAPGGGLADDLW